MADVLSSSEVNEIADSEAGVTQAAVKRIVATPEQRTPVNFSKPRATKAPVLNVADIQRDGKVKISPTKNFDELST